MGTTYLLPDTILLNTNAEKIHEFTIAFSKFWSISDEKYEAFHTKVIHTWAPFIPLMPVSPMLPLSPLRPCRPGSPTRPGGPEGPWGPRGPGWPCNCVKDGHYTKIKVLIELKFQRTQQAMTKFNCMKDYKNTKYFKGKVNAILHNTGNCHGWRTHLITRKRRVKRL